MGQPARRLKPPDPARVPEAATPGGWPGLRYFRLHGSPRMYYSEYHPDFIARMAQALLALEPAETWCIFDNTTSGAATANALALQEQISRCADRPIRR